MQVRQLEPRARATVAAARESATVPQLRKNLRWAAALIDHPGSRFSGTKSVEIETPALKAAADNERFVLVGEIYAGVFPRVAKMPDLELTRYPKKLGSLHCQLLGHRL